jgi:hypothetical protein
LVRRDVALSVGGFEEHFRGPYQVYEDQAFFSKVLLQAPAFVSSETWDRYRQHPDSCYAIAKATGAREVAREYFLKWFRRYLREHGSATGTVWDAVSAELRPFRLRTKLVSRYRTWAGRAMEPARSAARTLLPRAFRRWAGARLDRRNGVVRPVRFGDLRQLAPVSRHFGWDRGGLPVDRYYIERFLERQATDVAGHVLEVRDDSYARKFGGARVTRCDVLHPTADNPKATIVADLACAAEIPSDTFDCIVLTQVLPFMPDVAAAARTLQRILRPGGVVLATMPGISQVIRYDMDRWGDYWRFTSLSARRLFECAFPGAEIQVEAHGNVLAATAFLQGISSRELRPHELDFRDPDYEVLITVRAVKPAGLPGPAQAISHG